MDELIPSGEPSASSLRCTKQRSENTVTASASPWGQWQGNNLMQDNTTAKGLREEERQLEAQQTPQVRGQADLSSQRTYQTEILEAIQTTVLINGARACAHACCSAGDGGRIYCRRLSRNTSL